VREAGGIIWAYLGPPDKQPTFPDFDWMDLPPENRVIIKVQVACNWVQSLEGVIDSAHIGFLHADEIKAQANPVSQNGAQKYEVSDTPTFIRTPSNDPRPRFEVETTAYGFKYAAIRKPIVEPDRYKYVRTTHFIAPFWGLWPPPAGGGNMQAFVPVDDETTHFYHFQYNLDTPIDADVERKRLGTVIGVDLYPDFRRVAGAQNGYLQDRAAMQRGESSTGIRGVQNQDMAVQESMGPIYDRTREHLGISDVAVIRLRRVMLDSVQIFQEGGEPIGLGGTPIPYGRLRGADRVILIDEPWQVVGAPQEPSRAAVSP
jgi:phthalate 4,5-dioxygenase oxygenase subunit